MKSDQKVNILIAVLLFILLLIVGIIINTFLPKQKAPEVVSSFQLSPAPKISPTSEPEISSYRTYNNEQYLFSISVPDGWNIQDYSKAHPQGGTVVAFSPQQLPCDSCTYFQNGYFSIKIYNQKTYPEQYALFLQKMNSIGKKEGFKGIVLGKEKAVLFQEGAAVANHGWVYEFILDNKNYKNATDSKVFLMALTSLAFTGLEFEK